MFGLLFLTVPPWSPIVLSRVHTDYASATAWEELRVGFRGCLLCSSSWSAPTSLIHRLANAGCLLPPSFQPSPKCRTLLGFLAHAAGVRKESDHNSGFISADSDLWKVH